MLEIALHNAIDIYNIAKQFLLACGDDTCNFVKEV